VAKKELEELELALGEVIRAGALLSDNFAVCGRPGRSQRGQAL